MNGEIKLNKNWSKDFSDNEWEVIIKLGDNIGNHLRKKIAPHGKVKVMSNKYSRYESLFATICYAKGFSNNKIWEEFSNNPFCLARTHDSISGFIRRLKTSRLSAEKFALLIGEALEWDKVKSSEANLFVDYVLDIMDIYRNRIESDTKKQ